MTKVYSSVPLVYELSDHRSLMLILIQITHRNTPFNWLTNDKVNNVHVPQKS